MRARNARPYDLTKLYQQKISRDVEGAVHVHSYGDTYLHDESDHWLKCACGETTGTGYSEAFDANGDGAVDVRDLVRLKNQIAAQTDPPEKQE